MDDASEPGQASTCLTDVALLAAESVTIGRYGDLYMLDKFGVIWKATGGGAPQRLFYLGAGRPLGFHFDQAGNLIICNSPLVSWMQLHELHQGQGLILQKKLLCVKSLDWYTACGKHVF